jgi:hypothetical protein
MTIGEGRAHLEEEAIMTNPRMSAAIAESWEDPETRAKRLARRGVRVRTWTEFSSPEAALRAVGLPLTSPLPAEMEFSSFEAALRELGMPVNRVREDRKRLRENGTLEITYRGREYLFEDVP